MPWQVLAAINEIETDYGRNLSVSSAGAVGWMQFLPSTWKAWGVDANGDGDRRSVQPGRRDLHRRAVPARRRRVQESVAGDLRLQPRQLVRAVGAAARQADRRDPVAADRRADRPGPGPLPGRRAGQVRRRLGRRAGQAQGARARTPRSPIDSDPEHQGHLDLRQAGLAGDRRQRRQDRQGRRQTSSSATTSSSRTRPATSTPTRSSGSVSKTLPGAQAGQDHRPRHRQGALAPGEQGARRPGLRRLAGRRPQAATARQAVGRRPPAAHSLSAATVHARPRTEHRRAVRPPPPAAQTQRSPTPLVKERLFANPSGPASYAAGGDLQLKNTGQQISSFQNYFSDALHLGSNQYTLKPLKAGSIVVAGTILGRIGGASQGVSLAPVLHDPAGRQERAVHRPQADPRRLEAAGGDRRLPRRRRRSVLRPRRQEPDASARSC